MRSSSVNSLSRSSGSSQRNAALPCAVLACVCGAPKRAPLISVCSLLPRAVAGGNLAPSQNMVDLHVLLWIAAAGYRHSRMRSGRCQQLAGSTTLGFEAMIAVIFEFTLGRWPHRGSFRAGAGAACRTSRADRSRLSGWSRDASSALNDPGKFVSLSFWRDEAALRQWRTLERHRGAQAAGRGGIFFPITVPRGRRTPYRDYGMAARDRGAGGIRASCHDGDSCFRA